MHFHCKCGHRISNTSDYLPYSASLVADVDLEDYWEAWERRGRGQALGVLSDPMDYEQTIYQCEECKRIWFDDPDDPAYFISFVPDDKSVMVTGPSEGRKWKGYIYGYSDLGMERSIGSCFTSWLDGERREERSFETYEDMRAYFDSKVEELKGQGLLRRAWVNKDGETVFSWNLDDSAPVQEKHEIYLTEEEQTALATFQSEHSRCHLVHPRGPRGWNFAYEVLPGICGADDRDLKATCLRCGAVVESIDGKIAWRDGANAPGVIADDFTKAVLNLLHEHGSRSVRSETVSMPERHHEVAAAVGYVRGLVDTARMLDPDTPLAGIAQHVFSLVLNEERFEATSKLRGLVRNVCSGESFDWVVEEGLEGLKAVLKERYPDIRPDWIDEPKNERHGPSLVR